jgi:AcrR family transcriptional regulator
MGQIAAEAQMSVGQIYRYFPSKEAIVHAIVERIVTRRVAWMLSREENVDLPELFANRRDFREDERSDRVLLLEITAEATRNPAVAEIVREADRRLHLQAVALVRADFPGLSEQEAVARVEFIAVLSEGSAFRHVTEQHAEPAELAAVYRGALEHVFPNAANSRLLRKPQN